MRAWAAVAVAVCLGVMAHLVTTAAASTMTVTSPPGVVQAERTGRTVTASVTDPFTVPAATALDGQVSDYNGGAGAVTDAGPTWVASPDWTNSAPDYVLRTTGSGFSMARVPWLTRQSTVSISVRSYGTSVDAGVMMGANDAGTEGVAAALYYSGGYRFALFVVTSGTPALCSAELALSGTGGRTVTISFDPSAGGTATGTISGGGGGTVTSTCSLAGADGSYAGLYANSASTARYDAFNARL